MLQSLVFLACPLGMGLMMWFMMRGNSNAQPAQDESSAAEQTELARLRAEIDLLRRDVDSTGPARQSSPS